MKKLHILVSASLLLLLSAFAEEALAQAVPADGEELNDLLTLYKNGAQQWESTLANYAIRLFAILAVIDMAWTGITLAFKSAVFEEWLATILNRVLFIGFFYALLLHSSDWAYAIIDSLRTAADVATINAGGSSSLRPADIFNAGINIATIVWAATSVWDPGAMLFLGVSAIIILICYALIAAMMTLALVQSYVIVSAGIIVMGFGGSRWTKDYAQKMFVYALAIGMKLFVMQLIVGLGESTLKSWVNDFEMEDTSLFVLIGSSIVMLALTKTVPDMVQSIISGSAFSNVSAITGSATAVGTGVAAAAGAAAGAGLAVGGAAKLAGAQHAASQAAGTGSASLAGRTGAFAMNTAKNMGGAMSGEFARKMSGQHYPGKGNAGARMGAEMREEGRALKEKAKMRKEESSANTGSGNNNTIKAE